MHDITVAIPTIPPRRALLRRAIESTLRQTIAPAALAVAIDTHGDGAPKTRQRALEAVTTDWVAFLDDDDEMLPEHLEILLTAAVESNADYVFSYYRIRTATGVIDADPVLGLFGVPFDVEHPHQTTITTLVRTELAQAARQDNLPNGFIDGRRAGEDFQFTLRCVELGAHIVHVPKKTWIWSHAEGTPPIGNTSGRPWNQMGSWT